MDNWLHVYFIKHKDHRKSCWAYSRSRAKRPLLMSYNKDWVIANAKFFAQKHNLLLFIHDVNGYLDNCEDHRQERLNKMNISIDFKTHYNETMTNKLLNELPNLSDSKNVARVHVRAKFKDKEEPEYLNIHVHLTSGKLVKFQKEPRYLFPTEGLVAKIGLLL